MASLRAAYNGSIIACGGFDRDKGEAILARGQADLVAIGKPYIVQPRPGRAAARRQGTDAAGTPTPSTPAAPKGYTDYPALTPELTAALRRLPRRPAAAAAARRGGGRTTAGARRCEGRKPKKPFPTTPPTPSAATGAGCARGCTGPASRRSSSGRSMRSPMAAAASSAAARSWATSTPSSGWISTRSPAGAKPRHSSQVVGQQGGKFNARHVGSWLGVSNIEVPTNTTKVLHGWLQKNFNDGRVSLLAGLYPIDSEFSVLDSAGVLRTAALRRARPNWR